MKKLRLLVTEECNRDCEGCCNKDWDLPSLEKEDDFSQYDLIMITGGEPLLVPYLELSSITKTIRTQTDSPIYLYTANTAHKDFIHVMRLVDGVTVTLHSQLDAVNFYNIKDKLERDVELKSKRLNIFKGVRVAQSLKDGWEVKDNIEWIKDASLPENEVFKKF